MANRKVKEIAEDYINYLKLVKDRKTIYVDTIEVNSKANNNNFVEKIERLYHTTVNKEVTFTVNVKIKDHTFFQFKLRCKEFCPQHFFRFDSDGEAHRNRIDGIPLHEQLVLTPHFHKYDSSGIEIAYQTNLLKDERERSALKDINLCIKHFFHESNTRYNEDDFSEIKIMSDTLGFSLECIDPNENIHFI
jgi:hypothetical protein